MNFTVKQKALAELVGIAAKIPSKSTIAILECVKLSFSENGFSVEATNMENWISLSTSGFNPVGCSVAIVPCKQFYSIISSIPKTDDITFSITDKKVAVKTANAKYNFGLQPIAEWPALPPIKKSSQSAIMSAGDLVGVLSFLKPCIGVSEARAYLCGVNIETIKPGYLRFNSADGHRATIASIPINGTMGLKSSEVIISRDNVAIQSDLLSKAPDETEVSLEIAEGRCIMQYTADYSVSLVGRMLDMQYPDLDQLVPYKTDGFFAVDVPREDIIDSLNRLEIMSHTDKEKGSPGVKIDFAANTIKLSVSGSLGDAQEEITCEMQDPKAEACILVGIANLMSLLSAYKGKTVVMLFGKDKARAATQAVILSDKGAVISPESEGFSIFMPMKG